MIKQLDIGSIIVILLTLVLFIAAMFVKGLSQDALLEAGVFLVSVKIIMMSNKNYYYMEKMKKELDEIKDLVLQAK
jgi:hypothetical protein